MKRDEIALELTKTMIQSISITIPTYEFKNHQALADAVGEYYCRIFNKISDVICSNEEQKLLINHRRAHLQAVRLRVPSWEQ